MGTCDVIMYVHWLILYCYFANRRITRPVEKQKALAIWSSGLDSDFLSLEKLWKRLT
jgi:hypothetical protein